MLIYVHKSDVFKSQYIYVERYKHDLLYGNVYDNVQGENAFFPLQYASIARKQKIGLTSS